MESQITLVQSPVIKHQLEEVGKSVTKRINDLELDKTIATLETLKSFKDLRAELNKELDAFENQRKAIKEGVNKPYLSFEELYKTEISDKYKDATNTLKDKIASVEDKIKRDKKTNLETYFTELCQSESIDFITFDKLEIDVNLSTTEKKYKEQIFEYIQKVIDDLNLIKSTDYEAEILTEYKLTLNASKSITTVKERKEKEAAETAKLKAEQTQNRKNYLNSLGLNYVEITDSFEFNEDIYVSLNDINTMSKEDFTAKYAEIQVKINEFNANKVNVVETTEAQTQETPIASPPRPPVSNPISAPKVEVIQEEIKTASFEVKATMAKLRLLGEYMKREGITYKNI
jgi:hypothetical protein